MAVSNATTTTTKLFINGDDNSNPRPTKRRRTSDDESPNSNYTKRSIQTPLRESVECPTRILQKTLQTTDLDLYESRLLLTSKVVEPSPLLGLLTDAERESVREKSGLKVRAFDRYDREYRMVFKFLRSNNAYRLIGEWSRFLRENDGAMRAGDAIEIWGFRIHGEEGRTEMGMSLLHYEKQEEDDKEKERKSLIKENASKSMKSKGKKVTEKEEDIGKKRKSVRERNANKSIESKKMKVTEEEDLTADEWTVVAALLQLKAGK